MSLARVGEIAVGLVILGIYTGLALAGLLFYGWLLADPPGLSLLAVAFALGVVIAAVSGYKLGTVRLVSHLDARELPVEQIPELNRRLERLCLRLTVTRPPILVADLDGPNALSTGGPGHGAVIIDQRLLSLLTIDELEAIIAHEVAHIDRRDTLVNSLALTGVRSLVGLVFILLLPIAIALAGVDRATGWIAGRPGHTIGLVNAFSLVIIVALGIVLSVFTLSFLWYSRRQEYAADRYAVEATGKPIALARALAKIDRASDPRAGLVSILYTHETRNEQRSFLSTHPPIDRRIDRLLRYSEDSPRNQQINRLRSD